MLHRTLTAASKMSVFMFCYLFLLLASESGGGHASPLREKFIVLSSELSPREGQTLTLSCFIGGPPQSSIPSPSSYEWVKDGKVIPSQTGQTLTIERLSGQDDGDYQCGPPGSDVPREVFHLDVIRSEKSPLNGIMFYVDKFGSTLQGRTATLRCYLFGLLSVHPSSYQWLKDAKVIAGATHKDLPLKSLSSSDTGDYLCGDPSMKYPRRNYHLQVITILPTPTIFKDRLPVCGQPFSLNCLIMAGYSTTGDTAYTWYKDSTEIKGQTGQVLCFDNVTEADTGKYTCTARDGPMDTTSHHSQAFDLDPLMNPELRIKQASPNSLLKGVVGENLTMTCEVIRSNPMVPYKGYSWSFLPSLQVSSRPLAGTSRTLTLGPLAKEDAGQYFCQARNDQNFETVTLIGQTSVTVDILYLENISVTATTRVNESDHVTITCKVDSHPIAHLVWVVHGEEVRHVIDNLDHYVVPKAACTDSTNYTCRATNADLPGRNISATARLLVNCEQEMSHNEVERVDGNKVDVTAQFHFSFPEHTSVVVVCPDNQDIITVHQNCSFVISPKFRSRCLHPQCNTDSHHLTFTLTHVTNRDEGHYSCLEAKQRKPIVGCDQRLVLKAQESGGTREENDIALVIGVVIKAAIATASVILIIIYRRKLLDCIRLLIPKSESENHPRIELGEISTESPIKIDSHSFDTLYKNGEAYIFPTLVQPGQVETTVSEDDSAPLLPSSPDRASSEGNYTFNNLVRFILQQTNATRLPSFLLHNMCLTKEETISVILHRNWGVVLIVVKPFFDLKHQESITKAAEYLLKVKRMVKEKLRGLAKTITTAIALPNISEEDKQYSRQHLRDVQMLLGKEETDFKRWAEQWEKRPDSDVWDLNGDGVDSADTAFKMAASKFLTLADCYHSEEPSPRPNMSETWLLTPAQMKVRDNTAKLLHIWGPPGSGKSALLIHRARQWLAEGKTVVIAVGTVVYDVLLAHVVKRVLREQSRETRKKVRVCRIYSELEQTLTELKSKYPDSEICLFIDALRDPLLFENTLKAIRSHQVSHVWSVCRESLQTLDSRLSQEAKKLGWESHKLPVSIRCTENTVELLNQLGKDYSSLFPIEACSVPRAPDIPKWRVVDHCFHPNHTATTLKCDHCNTELSKALNLPKKHLRCSDWFALYTGNPNVFNDIKPICDTLQTYGIPATLDSPYDIVASHGAHLDSSETVIADWYERVVAGIDEKGSPTIHLVRVRDTVGMEKEGVLLVHRDERDNDPKLQSEEERKARLKEHRWLWILAVSRCKGQVVLLLLTPSPARSLIGLPEAPVPTAK